MTFKVSTYNSLTFVRCYDSDFQLSVVPPAHGKGVTRPELSPQPGAYEVRDLGDERQPPGESPAQLAGGAP